MTRLDAVVATARVVARVWQADLPGGPATDAIRLDAIQALQRALERYDTPEPVVDSHGVVMGWAFDPF